MLVCLHVNGSDFKIDVDPDEKLLDTLREKLHITSVKRGCENGRLRRLHSAVKRISDRLLHFSHSQGKGAERSNH